MSAYIEQQIAYVLAGRTAFGGASAYGPIEFPRDPAAFSVLRYWTTRFYAEVKAIPSEAHRTQFIRKFAGYLIRHGYHDDDRNDYLLGLLWFTAQPNALLTKLSFRGAVRQQRQQLALANASEMRRADAMVAEAMSVDPPPCPVLLRDGLFRLYQLIHPLHLIDAGRSASNCLVQSVGSYETPNSRYWARIATGEAMLFVIAHDDRLCAVFSIAHGAVREWEYYYPPLGTLEFVAKVTATLEARQGPLRDELGYILFNGETIDTTPWLTPDRREQS